MRDLFKNGNLKFGVENFLLVYLNRYQFVLGSDLEAYAKDGRETFNKENPCNIYFILKRSKVTVEPDSVRIKDKIAEFDLKVHMGDHYNLVSLIIEFDQAKSKIEFITEYPYNMLAFKDETDMLLLARPSLLMDSDLVQNSVETENLDYEILYIGQAYGADGNRNAFDRLTKHETLQKIYSHSLTQYPDSDIWIMLAEFNQNSMLFSAPYDDVIPNKANSKVDDQKAKSFFDNKGIVITEKQRINFIEAGLIHYFKPSYNEKFKNHFPSSKHSSYSECYELDVRALNIELDFSELKRKVFTKKSGRKTYHKQMFEFKTAKDRISLMDI